MADRRKEVKFVHSTWYECEEHGWTFTEEDGDVCPMCAGEKIAEERIIKLVEGLDCGKNGNPNHDTHDCLYYMTADSLIALIKGEQKSQSEHLTDAIQTTVWAYEEGEQK